MRPRLENIMMSQLSLTYGEARKLVSEGRENLGMHKFDDWTPELEEECARLYEASGGTVKMVPKAQKEEPVKVEPKKVEESHSAQPESDDSTKQPEPEPSSSASDEQENDDDSKSEADEDEVAEVKEKKEAIADDAETSANSADTDSESDSQGDNE